MIDYLALFDQLSWLQKLSVLVVPLVLAVTVHEAAHGYAAKYYGDVTAEKMGRITLNPLSHIDLVGTIIMPMATMMIFGLMFGWAKPVPVNFANLRNPKKDMLWVALAGPASNFAMAVAWAIALGLLVSNMTGSAALFAGMVCFFGVLANSVLMILNLIPMPPLDGGRIAVSLLPMQWAVKFSRVERYGIVILLILMATGLLWKIIMPLIQLLMSVLLSIFA